MTPTEGSTYMITSPNQSFLAEIKSDRPLSVGALAYLEGRLAYRLYDFVMRKFEEAEAERGLTQADLARRIRKRPEVVSRLLSTPGNWTIGTVSSLLAGISAEEFVPASTPILGMPPRNQQEPEWCFPRTERPQRTTRTSSEAAGSLELV